MPAAYEVISRTAQLGLSLVFAIWAVLRFVSSLQHKRTVRLFTAPEWMMASFNLSMALGFFFGWTVLVTYQDPTFPLVEMLRVLTLASRVVALILGLIIVGYYYVRVGMTMWIDFQQWRQTRGIGQ